MGSAHVTDSLLDLALDSLGAAERETAKSHLRECARCRAELRSIRQVVSSLAVALPPVAPSAGARKRLMASLTPGGRFAAHVDAVARMLDIATARAVSFLELVDSPAAPWEPLPILGVTGIDYLEPPRSERLANAVMALVRLAPAARFPRHRHGGVEEVLVLEGGFRDEADGMLFHPGMLQHNDVGSDHSFVGLPGEPCICLGVIRGPLEMLEGSPFPS